MKKTSIYLSERDLRRLAHLARAEGTSNAEVIRRALAAYAPRRSAARAFQLARSADGPGGSIADIPEEELLDGFGS